MYYNELFMRKLIVSTYKTNILTHIYVIKINSDAFPIILECITIPGTYQGFSKCLLVMHSVDGHFREAAMMEDINHCLPSSSTVINLQYAQGSKYFQSTSSSTLKVDYVICYQLCWIPKSSLQTGALYINIYDNRYILTFNETQLLNVLPEADI